MVNQTFKVEYGGYTGYASTEEEAKKLEEEFKQKANGVGVDPMRASGYEDYLRDMAAKAKETSGNTLN